MGKLRPGRRAIPGLLYDIAVGPNGDVYVRDEVREDIQQFTSEGKYVRVVGKHGTGCGH